MSTRAPSNRLLDLLDAPAREQMLAEASRVDWAFGDTLAEAHQRSRHVHFPVSGFASLLVEVDGHAGLETAMIGREGVLGVYLLLGLSQEPQRAMVQGSGAAWRVGLPQLRDTLALRPLWHGLLLRYAATQMAQGARGAACLHYHAIVPRLARWLLMSQDRARSDSYALTQEFLAGMLGVRRVGVTQAAGKLRQLGLIAYHRGVLQVLDRAGLEGQACSCYAEDLRISALAQRLRA